MNINKLHPIKTIYKRVALCKNITCLCGETYKEHKIDHVISCADCNNPLTFGKYSIIVEELGDGKSITSHPIGVCDKCNGIDLFNWKEDINSILTSFNSDNNVHTITTR